MPERTLIAGVDFGTRAVHLVRRREGTVEAEWRRYAIESHAADANGDALAARDAGQAILAAPEWWDDVYLAGVEYPFARAGFTMSNKTILGAICATIPEHVHVMPLPPGLWTGWFLRERLTDPLPKVPRKGVERKPLIKARALDLLGRADAPWPQDVYDAFGISWAAELMNLPALDARPQAKVES